MSGRTCPVPGCGAPAKNGHLMCRPCWDLVPRFIQLAINRAWKNVRRGGFGMAGKRADYERHCQGAVKLVEAKR